MIGTQQGLGPQLLEGPNTPSAGLVAFPAETFQTPLLDLTKTYSGIELVPARPGHYPIFANSALASWVIESFSGTQTVPVTIQAGNDAAHTNFFPSTNTTPSNANVNGAVPPSSATGPSTAFPTNNVQIFPGLPVFLDVTAPAAGTGGYACMARLTVTVAWVAVGP